MSAISSMDFDAMFKPYEVAVYDPIIDLQSKKAFPVLKGGVETTERQFVSSTYSNSSTQFSVPPPTPNTFVSRRFQLLQPVTVTITGTSTSGGNPINIFQTGFSAFRQSPLASIMQTLDITFNGQSVSLNMNDIIKPLLLYHNNFRNLFDREMSMSPMCRDQSQQYSDLVDSSNSSNRNPLEGFPNSNPRAQQPRGAFSYTNVDETNAPNTIIIQADLCEELYLSPLLFGGVEGEGFIGLQRLDVNITWDNNLDKIWSHTPYSVNEANYDIDVQLGQPKLLFRYVTPPLNYKMPPFMQYDYNEIQRYPTNVGDLASGGSITATSSNIQLNSIPRFLYVFARLRNSDFTYDATDSYMGIEGIRINWNNQNALLSNASQQQLYDISRKNGVDASWNEWSAIPTYVSSGDQIVSISGIGSVLCLEFGTDVGLREDEAPGMIGTYNLQVEVDLINNSDSQQDITLYLITVIPGIFSIYNNTASKRIGILSKEGILSAKPNEGLDYHNLKYDLKCGGKKRGFLRRINFGKIIRKASNAAQMYSPLIESVLPKAAPYVKMINEPIIKARKKRKARKKVKRKNKSKGGSLVGGKKKR